MREKLDKEKLINAITVITDAFRDHKIDVEYGIGAMKALLFTLGKQGYDVDMEVSPSRNQLKRFRKERRK
jgi:hypothetical protein